MLPREELCSKEERQSNPYAVSQEAALEAAEGPLSCADAKDEPCWEDERRFVIGENRKCRHDTCPTSDLTHVAIKQVGFAKEDAVHNWRRA